MAWRAQELRASMTKKLALLDEVDGMCNTECETDVTQLRYNLIRRSINTIFS